MSPCYESSISFLVKNWKKMACLKYSNIDSLLSFCLFSTSYSLSFLSSLSLIQSHSILANNFLILLFYPFLSYYILSIYISCHPSIYLLIILSFLFFLFSSCSVIFLLFCKNFKIDNLRRISVFFFFLNLLETFSIMEQFTTIRILLEIRMKISSACYLIAWYSYINIHEIMKRRRGECIDYS